MLDYTQTLQTRGVLMASSSLKSASVRLRKSDGSARVVDGPFTETKELTFASECPAAEWATIEVREVGPCYE